MNLLLDFITIQAKTGASEYARYFFWELARLQREGFLSYINLYALFDSSKQIAYEDLKKERFSSFCKIDYIDIADESLETIIDAYKIDRFFITCAQYLGNYKGIEDVKCEVICVIHDLCDQEFYHNHIYEYVDLIRDHTQVILNDDSFKTKVHNLRVTLGFVKRFILNRKNRTFVKSLNRMNSIVKLLHKNPQSKIIVVSEYTKSSLIYNYGFKEDSISVLYSPERIYAQETDEINNKKLHEIIESKVKYYLLVSASRALKNPNKAVRAFRQYAKSHPDTYLLTIGYSGQLGKNILNLDFLTDNDLALAYQHCYALIYPSFFEGFGYPPIEAMHYGKPILSTNTTSVPEILGDAPIYFSPFFESGIYKALTTLTRKNYEFYCESSRKQYRKVKDRQIQDTNRLLYLLTTQK